MANNQLLRNAFPKWFEGGGVFAAMQNPPWEDDIDGVTLDIEYFGNRSGYKFCAPLVYNFLDENGAVTDNGKQAIARVIMARYGKPWARLWNLMKSQYDPLDNYTINEEIDITTHGSGTDTTNGKTLNTGTLTTDYTGDETLESTGTEKTAKEGLNKVTVSDNRNSSASNSRSGFNSAANVAVSGQLNTGMVNSERTELPVENVTRTPELTDTRTRNLQDIDTHDLTQTIDNTVERDNTQTEKGTRTRSGVNGLISRQRLLEEEREAWQWDFFEAVFSDVDKVMALSVYDPCVVEQFDYTGGGTSGGYVLPVATQSLLGGVRAPAKTDSETVRVHVDSSGFLYVKETEVSVATASKAGIVKAAKKTDATTPVQVDTDGTLYVPESGIKTIPVATESEVGGIKLPTDPTGDGEEISTKHGVQYKVDASLKPDGGLANDDTVSVVIPFAGNSPGLVKGIAKTSETQQVAVSSDGTMWVPASGGAETLPEYDLGAINHTVTKSGVAKYSFPNETFKGKEKKFIGKFKLDEVDLIGTFVDASSGTYLSGDIHLDSSSTSNLVVFNTWIYQVVSFNSNSFLGGLCIPSPHIVTLPKSNSHTQIPTQYGLLVTYEKALITNDGTVLSRLEGSTIEPSVERYDVIVDGKTVTYTLPT